MFPWEKMGGGGGRVKRERERKGSEDIVGHPQYREGRGV